MNTQPGIFVQIASYRDTELQWTLKSLFETAKYPSRIQVGIAWQYDAEADADCFRHPSPNPKQTHCLFFSLKEAQGVCWARYQAQKLYQGETYVLMIDSHMRFSPHWDEILIEELAKCESDKPFLSTYPASYTLPNKLTDTPYHSVICAKHFQDSGTIRFKGRVLATAPHQPLRGAFLAAGFLFTRGEFILEVPYDPYLYFDQEEVCLSARAFTHGWDSFIPSKIILYHLYNTEQVTRPLHWEDRENWQSLAALSQSRYRALLCREPPATEAAVKLEQYSLGCARSLEAFEQFSGLDFINKETSARAEHAWFVPDLNKYL